MARTGGGSRTTPIGSGANGRSAILGDASSPALAALAARFVGIAGRAAAVQSRVEPDDGGRVDLIVAP
jgi:hypothetical protein